MRVDLAYAYHARHKPQILRVQQVDSVVFERCEDGFAAGKPHALYSGTKSFWGIAAVLAQAEGLLSLDESVWHGATVRQLLDLTAGLAFGGLGTAVPTYEKALRAQQRDAPGTRFTYGGIPLQIFGAVFAQRLEPLGLTPHEFLRRRVLEPQHVEIASWRTLTDGAHPLPTGASLTAENWARFGKYVCRNAGRFEQCFRGSPANPRYGLCWWLAPAGAPADLAYASGSGGQAMYVVPSQQLVVVRFGAGGSFNHQAFLRQLFSQ